MGIIRKAASVSTLGLVKFRSTAETSNKIARQTRNAARANVVQNQILIDLQRQQMEQEYQAQAMRAAQVAAIQLAGQQPALPAQRAAVQPGWYPDPRNNGGKAWWDGQQWLLPQWDGHQWVLPQADGTSGPLPQ